MMFARIQGLSVVITPGGEHLVSLALAGAAVGLDLDATNRLGKDIMTHLLKLWVSFTILFFEVFIESMMYCKVSWLSIVITPGGKVIIPLAGSSVHLDLDPAHRLRMTNIKLK